MDVPVRRPGERPPGDFVNHSDTSPEFDFSPDGITVSSRARRVQEARRGRNILLLPGFLHSGQYVITWFGAPSPIVVWSCSCYAFSLFALMVEAISVCLSRSPWAPGTWPEPVKGRPGDIIWSRFTLYSVGSNATIERS